MIPFRGNSNTAQVIMVCGVSGSGKTCCARQYETSGYRVISADQLIWDRYGSDFLNFSVGRRKEIYMSAGSMIADALEDALSHGEKAVVDAALCKRFKRESIRQLCRQHGASCSLIYCCPDPDLIRERLSGRSGLGPHDQKVSEQELAGFLANFEVPGPDEKPIYMMQQIVTTEIPVERMLKAYRDVERFEGCCRQCNNFNKCWICPPFEFDTTELLSQWSTAFLAGIKVDLPQKTPPGWNVEEFLFEPRKLVETRLLEMEKEYGGISCGLTSFCRHCTQCSRPEGKPCRNPDKARPSLEGYGFDVCKIMETELNTPLEWATLRNTPRTMTLVGALFHNLTPGTVRFEK